MPTGHTRTPVTRIAGIHFSEAYTPKSLLISVYFHTSQNAERRTQKYYSTEQPQIRNINYSAFTQNVFLVRPVKCLCLMMMMVFFSQFDGSIIVLVCIPDVCNGACECHFRCSCCGLRRWQSVFVKIDIMKAESRTFLYENGKKSRVSGKCVGSSGGNVMPVDFPHLHATLTAAATSHTENCSSYCAELCRAW